MKKPIVKRLSKDNYEINITGNRDPRGPDVDISASINSKDEIEIIITKSQRCYEYEKTIDEQGKTTMVFS